jgi:hypothetical protein
LSIEEIIVPQMIGFDRLVKIIIGYLKVGAAEGPKSYSEVAKVSSVAANNVGLNAKFFEYIGMLEGDKANYRLTEKGKQYAQALDWGKLAEANSTLKEVLKENALAKKALAYVDINQPVKRDDLVSQIAIIADKPKKGRYITGIQGFVEMLVTSGLLQSDSIGILTASKEKREELGETYLPSSLEVHRATSSSAISLPMTLSINVDDKTDVVKLKEVLKAIKEIFSEQ